MKNNVFNWCRNNEIANETEMSISFNTSKCEISC